MDKKLFKTREDIYKKCPSVFWEVSIFCLIIGIAFIALDTVFFGFFVLTISLFFMPLLYSTYMTLYSIKFGGTVTFKSTFSISLAYFRRNNFGCFRIMRCFFKALLVDLIAVLFLFGILMITFENAYGDAFTESYNKVLEFYSNGDAEAVLNYLAESNPAALYFDCVSSFSASCAVIAFIFGIAFNSPNVYLCANIPGATAQFSTAVFNKFLKNNAHSYRKDFWSLNWPVFVLLLFGIVAGYCLVILIDLPLSYGLPISTMVGMLCMIPFAPFFFAGMEALFAKYNGHMKQASVDLTNGFLKELKNNANLSEEDKAKIEELLSKKDAMVQKQKEEDENDISFDNESFNVNEEKNDISDDNQDEDDDKEQ